MRVAVDAIVFGYARPEGVSVALIRRKYEPFKNQWALPGGFVLPEETLEAAVKRELEEETSIRAGYLEQLYTFGNPDRDPRQRVIAVAYFGLVNTSQFRNLRASTDADDAAWFPVKSLPELAFDHKKIIATALERLRNKVRYEPVGFGLLDKKFAFADLEHLYASLLDQPLNRRNFSKKILSYGFLEETGELSPVVGRGRPSKVYRFNMTRYRELLKKGIHFEI